MAEGSSLKSKIKAVFSNSYLSFGLGLVVGLTIDNLFIVLALGLLVIAGVWYARKGKNEEGSENTGGSEKSKAKSQKQPG